ncbi:MAG TPA: hypothetical protein O0X27_02800, partial [Methanocorpusculum sp.]|nr:hypothetical protein [Methanocorpusculum sp.]
TVAEYLKKYHVPFHIYKGRDYYREPEVADILHVIRASVFREDDISLYGALISPYFGIADEQLARAVSAGPVTGPLRTRLEKCGDPQIRAALDRLDGFGRLFRTEPLSRVVRRIVRDCGILTVYAALEGGTDKVRNIRKFVEIADSQSAGSGIIGFIRTIETCISQALGSDELGGSEPDTASGDAVNIMTIHASKGLEFKVVALYRMGAGYDEKVRGPGLVYDQAYHYSYLGLRYRDGKDDLFGFMKHLIIAANKPEILAENRRVFYVAMTRARDHLVITTSKDPGTDSSMELLDAVAHDLVADRVSVCPCMPDDSCSTAVRIPEGWIPHLAVSEEITPVPDADTAAALRYGSCIHEIFEGKDIASVCRKYGLVRYRDRFAEIVAGFRASARLQNVEREWHELSFTTPGGETRRADMVVRYTDGRYRIIDFKSDDFRTIPDDRRKAYFDQLTEYSQVLTGIFGAESPIPACFYATQDGVFIDLEDILTYRPAA